MPTVMAEKIRLVLMVDEEIRAALRLEAAKRTAQAGGEEVSMSDVVSAVLSESLAETIQEIRKRREGGKRGRQ